MKPNFGLLAQFCIVLFLVVVVVVVVEGSVLLHHHHQQHNRHHQQQLQHDDNVSKSANNTSTEKDENKLLLECQHADYRVYIKCLKREKRQHFPGFGNQQSCLEQCFGMNCTTSACLHDCHTHCRKRLVETYSKTIETSFDCSDGECNERKASQQPNVTAIINITNNMPNITSDKVHCGNSGTSNKCNENNRRGNSDTNDNDCSRNGGKGYDRDESRCGNRANGTIIPKIDINNVINNQIGSGLGGNCNYPGCYPWQAMPQITIGIGGPNVPAVGQIGNGCVFPNWPCYPRYQTPQVDCSICANPFLQYQCNPICAQDNNRRNNTQVISQRGVPANQPNNFNNRYPL